MKKRCFVLAMAAVLLLGSVSTVSAAEVTTPEEPVREDRLINYPVNATLGDYLSNYYSVSGFCTTLAGGAGATTIFCISSYAPNSTPNEQALLNSYPKTIEVDGTAAFVDGVRNMPLTRETIYACQGDVQTSVTGTTALQIGARHEVNLDYSGSWWQDTSSMALY